MLNLNRTGASFDVRHKASIEYIRDADPNEHGTGCMVGTSASDSGGLYHDQYGRRFSGHWQVKPGREVNHTNVTRFMNVPFDTTVHYIAVRLHPFAESLELRDFTTGKTLYHSKARPSERRIGLSHVDYYASVEGLPDRHRCEVIACGAALLHGLASVRDVRCRGEERAISVAQQLFSAYRSADWPDASVRRRIHAASAP